MELILSRYLSRTRDIMSCCCSQWFQDRKKKKKKKKRTNLWSENKKRGMERGT